MKSACWPELDPRSLAVFRMVLGGFVVLDSLLRVPYLGEFMTDNGVLSRLQVVSSPYADYWLSFHLGSGNLIGQVVLSLILVGLGVGLTIGWRTHLMAAGCWVLVNSMHARNPFINDRGDLQLSLLLFWAIFLPLGAHWSLDKKQGRAGWGSLKGVASVGLVLQFAWIYLFAALLKTGDFWLARGDGLKFSLLSPMFSTDLASYLAHWNDGTLRLLNYSVIAGELFVAFLLLSPVLVSLCRQSAVVLLFSFHLVVLSMFKLGLFPLIGALTPLVFLPPEFWTRLGIPSSWNSSSTRKLPQFVQVFLGACILLGFLSNLSFRPGGWELQRPLWLAHLTQRLKLEQHWDLFAPLPPINGTFRLVSVTSDGVENVLFEGPPTSEKPDLQPFPSHRWKMLMLASIYPEFDLIRPSVARTLAKRFPNSSKGRLRYQFVLKPINQKGAFQRPVIQSLWVEP